MARLDRIRRLILEREASGMGEDGFEEAGLHQQYTFIQLLRQKNTQLQRMAQVLAVACLLLFVVALTSLITVVQGTQYHQSPGSQPTLQTVSHSSGFSMKQQQNKDFTNPSAMLTAPRANITDGKYLQWESKDGNAFCYGGFNYSRGDLVVPRMGIYRVFLQITYESKEGLMCPGQRLRLSNEVLVFRTNYPKDETLLSSVDTVNCSLKQWKKSLYSAGLFHLEANSRLRANSSRSDLIVKNEKQMFFGAELVSVIS